MSIANSNSTSKVDVLTQSFSSDTVATTALPSAQKNSVQPERLENEKKNCLNNGTVLADNRCSCIPGFYGNLCQFVKCSDETEFGQQCKNNGICLQHYVSKEPKCQCLPLFVGSLCEKPVCQDFCKNNGICNDGLNTEYDFEWNSTLIANLSCTCRSDRFAGKTCEFDKCSKKINSSMSSCYLDSSCNYLCNEECDRAYCKSNGVCYSDGGNLACKYKYRFFSCFILSYIFPSY